MLHTAGADPFHIVQGRSEIEEEAVLGGRGKGGGRRLACIHAHLLPIMIESLAYKGAVLLVVEVKKRLKNA